MGNYARTMTTSLARQTSRSPQDGWRDRAFLFYACFWYHLERSLETLPALSQLPSVILEGAFGRFERCARNARYGWENRLSRSKLWASPSSKRTWARRYSVVDCFTTASVSLNTLRDCSPVTGTRHITWNSSTAVEGSTQFGSIKEVKLTLVFAALDNSSSWQTSCTFVPSLFWTKQRWEWSPEAQMMLGRLALWKGALLVSRTHAIVAGEIPPPRQTTNTLYGNHAINPFLHVLILMLMLMLVLVRDGH